MCAAFESLPVERQRELEKIQVVHNRAHLIQKYNRAVLSADELDRMKDVIHPAVVVSPARDRPLEEHVRAGQALARAAAASPKRIALIASADHGHAHDASGPYGFSPASKAFDDRVVDLVKRDALGELLRFDRAFVADAKADSFWQMLMLHGAIADRWHGAFLSYEAPTYFGMLCAAYTPRVA